MPTPPPEPPSRDQTVRPIGPEAESASGLKPQAPTGAPLPPPEPGTTLPPPGATRERVAARTVRAPSPVLSVGVASATIAIAFAAAVILPARAPGIGLALLALAITALTATASPSSLDGWQRGAAGLAFAATPLPLITDAGWMLALVGLAWVAALGLISRPGATLRPGRRLAGGVVDVAIAPVAIGRPLLAEFRRRTDGRADALLRSGALAIALVLVFGLLMASGDQVFADLADRYLIPDLAIDVVLARVASAAITALFVGGVALHVRHPEQDPEPARGRGIGRMEWTTALVALVALFATFVAVQFGAWFGGKEFVEGAAGLTYAEYARSGFFQLLTIAGLVLAVVAAASRFALRETTRDERVLRVLLGMLTGLTLVIVASAVWRLSLYEQAFGASRLRLLATAGSLTVGALLTMVLVAGTQAKAAWVVRTGALLTVVSVIGLAYAGPDRIVAERNADRALVSGQFDAVYMANLSADAAEAIYRLPTDLRNRVMAIQPDRDHGDWLSWNLARARAKSLLDDGSAA